METLPLFGILAVLVLILIIMVLRSTRRNRAPVYTERAKLVQKKISVEQIGGRYQTENRHIDELIFETESGRIVVLRVAWAASRTISENDEGILTWQGDRFENFEQHQEERQ